MVRMTEYFGENVFSRKVMREKLPQDVYKRLIKVIDEGEKLDEKMAEVVANAMKEWAISKGATHYTHWFQPRTEATAEKHNAFLRVDIEGTPIEIFSGEELIQGEPDASSFPSGGMRSTFEARGYTAWDPSSPAFIVEGKNGNILCIPSVFISYTGEPLDTKTPLLRALSALEKSILRLIKLFGNRTVKYVRMTAGPEQEYFLIDKKHFLKRPDLIYCGRTLFGALPPKGQQMEDHYFGSIKPRILDFMQDMELELYKLGVAVKTRHNEVAPGQYEVAPWHQDANLACDQNQMVMETIRKVADKHGLAPLFHEKPFAGLNGSGKHVNFSIMDSEGRNLFSPSSNPRRNLQFLTLICVLLKAVNDYGGLLRASVASPGNMHRLGGNEAPPAIISVYLGEVLSSVLDNIENKYKEGIKEVNLIELGVNKLPAIRLDNTDRNRTSPVAFTGNKFEFRPVGAPASIAPPLTVMAAAMADAADYIASKIESKLAEGLELEEAVISVLKAVLEEVRRVRFDGNCYDPKWHKEAEERGLPIANTTPEALALYLEPKNIELFEKYNILRRREIEAFYDIKLDQYCKTVLIEMQVLKNMVLEGVLPALYKQLSLEFPVKEFISKAGSSVEFLSENVKSISAMIEDLLKLSKKLQNYYIKADSIEDIEEKADFITKECLPLMEKIRSICDVAELIVSYDFWIYPRYREMLFYVI